MKHVFDSVCNIRDLGNLINEDGKKVVPCKLFRGDLFQEMSHTDVIKFNELDIKDVVDFRSTREMQEHKADEVDGVNYHRIPAFKELADSHEFDMYGLIMGDVSEEGVMQLKKFMKEGYRVLPFDNVAYQTVFDLMLTSDHGILFHCSAGKDRTGVMAALILTLLGVDKKQIYQDFLMSNECRKQKNQQFLDSLDVKQELIPGIQYAIQVHSECLDATFEEIGNKYSSMEEFFDKEYGLDSNKIQLLKDKYLV